MTGLSLTKAGGSRRGAPLWLVLVVLGAALAITAGHVLPRAAFKPDDYRYLWQLREMDQAGWSALWRAMVVENRWDETWWIADGTYVRFLRPFVILSFALDRALFGESAAGFVASNLVWHLLSGAALLRCLERLRLPPAAVWVGALVHTLGAARYEHIAYVAGRTDTFAALAFFAAFALYLGPLDCPARELGARGPQRDLRDSRGSVAVVALAYAVALLAKEYAALLPLLFLAADRWCSVGSPSSPMARYPRWSRCIAERSRHYAACACVFLAYLGLRAWALGAGGAGAKPFPYFHLPPREGALEHALAAWWQDGVYLVAGDVGPAFLGSVGELLETAGWPAVLAAALVVPALLFFGVRRGGVGRFLAFAFLVTLVPLLGLYTTGRYLALASLGWSGLVGLVCAAAFARRRWIGVVAVLLAILPQAIGLHSAISKAPRRPPGSSEADALVEWVRTHGLLEDDRPLVLVDSSLHWLHRQFLPHILAIEEDRAELPRLWVLSQIAEGGERVAARVERVGPGELVLERGGSGLVQPHPWGDFDVRPCRVGERIEEPGFSVEVLGCQAGAPTRIRVRFHGDVDVRGLRATPAGPRWVAL